MAKEVRPLSEIIAERNAVTGKWGMEPRPQLYWDDVEEGQEIPGYSLEMNWTQIVKQVDGGQDFVPLHHDPEFAREAGHQEAFINTSFTQGCFNHLIQDWIGDEGFLRFFRMEMRRSIFRGDTMTLKGKVTKKYVQDSEHLVEADVWIENQNSEITTPCKCRVILPLKS